MIHGETLANTAGITFLIVCGSWRNTSQHCWYYLVLLYVVHGETLANTAGITFLIACGSWRNTSQHCWYYLSYCMWFMEKHYQTLLVLPFLLYVVHGETLANTAGITFLIVCGSWRNSSQHCWYYLSYCMWFMEKH